MPEIDHEYTTDPICPHCGHAVRDAWELSDSIDEWECGECESMFAISRHVDVTYNTRKIEP